MYLDFVGVFFFSTVNTAVLKIVESIEVYKLQYILEKYTYIITVVNGLSSSVVTFSHKFCSIYLSNKGIIMITKYINSFV